VIRPVVIAHLIFTISLPVCCAYALFRGGTPERLIAGMFIIATAATAATGLDEPRLGQTRWGVFAVDLALFIGLGTLALKANRIWPIWITSLQLVTVLSHLINIIMPGLRPAAYVWSITLTSLFMTWALAAATYMHRRRLKQQGADRSWSHF
jgi:hypothetical protein